MAQWVTHLPYMLEVLSADPHDIPTYSEDTEMVDHWSKPAS